MNNIDTIMHLLDWHRTPDEQQQGLFLASSINCLKVFFQPSGPGYGKSVWENCAKVIKLHTDSELIPYTVDMLLWLQDINWPGATIILQRLMQFDDVAVLACTMDRMIPVLLAIEDDSWLKSLSELLANKKLREAIDTRTVSVLNEFSTTN